MGCEVLVVLPTLESAALSPVRALFARWEEQLSLFRPGSEVCRLNALAGRPVRTGPLLRAVLRRALLAAEGTDGLFDPTLGRDIAALGYSGTFAELPDVVECAPVPNPAAGWRDIRIGADGTITVPRGIAVDLGGIAKGMAVDASLAALRATGASSASISAGGDLAVMGSLPDGLPWQVAVDGSEPVSLAGGALATSSIERRCWRTTAGMHHHLLDPRTRRPADGGVVRVSVHALSCQTAEVAAKVAVILGAERGTRFLRQRGLTAVVTTDSRTFGVGAWPSPDAGAAA